MSPSNAAPALDFARTRITPSCRSVDSRVRRYCSERRNISALRSALLVSAFLLTRTRRNSLPSSATRGYPRRTGAVLDLRLARRRRHIYSDTASGSKDERPGLASCLQSLREGDTLVVWKLDRLGRNLRHLVNTVHDLTAGGIGLRVLTGQGAAIDTTTAAGKLVFGIFAALAEFERELITERTRAGLASARAADASAGARRR